VPYRISDEGEVYYWGLFLMAVILKISLFWNVTQCSLEYCTKVSDELVT